MSKDKLIREIKMIVESYKCYANHFEDEDSNDAYAYGMAARDISDELEEVLRLAEMPEYNYPMDITVSESQMKLPLLD